MVTIVDVANAAHVSVATVSRVLNGNYVVTEEKKKRVMAAIEEVGYQIPARMKANQIAANPKPLILAITSVLIDQIIVPLQKAGDSLGYNVIVSYYSSHDQLGSLSTLLNTLESTLAGAILINAADNSPEFQKLFDNIPLVQIGEPIMEHNKNFVVFMDEVRAAQDATNYLLDNGKKKIAILTSNLSNLILCIRNRRLQGYYLALLDHNIPVDPSLVYYTDITLDGGYEAAQKAMAEHPDLDAILGYCDVLAQGALYAVRDAKRSANEITIFSIDNSDVWSFAQQNIPYMDFHYDELTSAAIQLLNSVIYKETTLDQRIVIRHTLHAEKRPDNKSLE